MDTTLKISEEILSKVETEYTKVIASFSIEEIREKLKNPEYKRGDKTRPVFYHGKIRVSLRRTRIHFKQENFKCVRCPQEGAFYLLLKKTLHNGNVEYHLDLFSEDGTLINIDHIHPISRGGNVTSSKNMQLMCQPCNSDKGNELEGGCTCVDCGEDFKIDVVVPKPIWDRIKPEGSAGVKRLLCGGCIFKRMEATEIAYRFKIRRVN